MSGPVDEGVFQNIVSVQWNVAPVIDTVSPGTFGNSDTVTVMGSNFGTAAGEVLVDISGNEMIQAIVSWSDTQIVFDVSAGGASGAGSVIVQAADLRRSAPAPVTVVYKWPGTVLAPRGDAHGAFCSLQSGTGCAIDFDPDTGFPGWPAGVFKITGQSSGNSVTFNAGGTPWCSPSQGLAAYENAGWLTLLYSEDGAQPGTGTGCPGQGWTTGESFIMEEI